jgi:ketosteroid isomerase-like protein
MSENLDLVRSIFDGWERGDYSAVGWADAEIEFTVADGPAPGKQTGLTGMAKAYRRFLSSWEDFRAGMVVRLVNYWDREHALADLGLVE